MSHAVLRWTAVAIAAVAILLVAIRWVGMSSATSSNRSSVSNKESGLPGVEEVPPADAVSRAFGSGQNPSQRQANFSSASRGTSSLASPASLLVQQLASLQTTNGIPAEVARSWLASLDELASQGPAAVPAIRAFLEQNVDQNFIGVKGGGALGYSSLRIALLNALGRIGGVESDELLTQTLGSTAVPLELAVIGNLLEQRAPGQHRDAVLAAAKEIFAVAQQPGWPGADIAPIVRMLAEYPGGELASAVQEIGPNWKFYSILGASTLPAEESVPLLIQQIRGETGGAHDPGQQAFAYQMLAQVAGQSESAGAALVEYAKMTSIPDASWIKIASGLAGDQYAFIPINGQGMAQFPSGPGTKAFHVDQGNQNFYSMPYAALNDPGQTAHRRSIIDQLLALNPGPAAEKTLQAARERLNASVAFK